MSQTQSGNFASQQDQADMYTELSSEDEYLSLSFGGKFCQGGRQGYGNLD